MRKIGGIFGRSPFGPIHEHMLKVVECLGMVGPLCEAAARGVQAEVRKAAKALSRVEGQADKLKSAIREQLTTSVLASVSRSEILALVKAQDDVADQCQRVGYELSIRKTAVPEFLKGETLGLSKAVTGAAKPLAATSRILDENGGRLGGKEAQRVRELMEEARGTMVESEKARDAFLGRLFRHESEVEVLDVMFLVRLAEGLDKVAGKVENVTDILARLVAEGGR